MCRGLCDIPGWLLLRQGMSEVIMRSRKEPGGAKCGSWPLLDDARGRTGRGGDQTEITFPRTNTSDIRLKILSFCPGYLLLLLLLPE